MRLIDADALEDRLHYRVRLYHDEDVQLCVTANQIDITPTIDAVPVVRCRDCKHWETDWPPSGFDPDNPRYFCSVNDIFPTGGWFCKDGERREDGDA